MKGGPAILLGTLLVLTPISAYSAAPDGADGCDSAALEERAAVDAVSLGCLLRAKRFAEVIERVAAQPTLTDQQRFLLGVAYFHRAAYAQARAAFDAVSPEALAAAELPLYRGLLALHEGRAADALGLIETAQDRGGARVEPIASYYKGLAQTRLAQYAAARQAFERVRSETPGGPWHQAALERLEELDGAGPTRPWLDASVGFEYDDNPLLQIDGQDLPGSAGSSDDIRVIGRARTGAALLRRPSWSLGWGAGLAWSAHEEWTHLDLVAPNVSLWGARRFGERHLARLAYHFATTSAGGDWFATTHTVSSSWSRQSRFGRTEWFGQLYHSEYGVGSRDVPDGTGAPFDRCGDPTISVCGPPGVREGRIRDRDGGGLRAGIHHRVDLFDARFEVTPRYSFQTHRADGRELRFDAHEFKTGIRVPLPYAFEAEGTAGFAYRPYHHASTVPDPKDVFFNRQYAVPGVARRDRVWNLGFLLSRPLSAHTSLSCWYRWRRNDSSLSAFDYDRGIAGLQLRVVLQP